MIWITSSGVSGEAGTASASDAPKAERPSGQVRAVYSSAEFTKSVREFWAARSTQNTKSVREFWRQRLSQTADIDKAESNGCDRTGDTQQLRLSGMRAAAVGMAAITLARPKIYC